MWATWWVWIVGGFALGVLEVIVPGYIFLGFAIGAVITGVLIGISVLGGSLPVAVLVCWAMSVQWQVDWTASLAPVPDLRRPSSRPEPALFPSSCAPLDLLLAT